MALTTRTKTLCSKCTNVPGILICRGYEKDFYYRHMAGHHEERDKQRDEVAEEAREQLLNVVDKHRTKVAESLALLTQELAKARNDADYVEKDLKEWTKRT